MMYEGIRHTCGFNDCYALNEDELCINIRTNKTITEVLLMQNDPYPEDMFSCWIGNPLPMTKKYSLQHEYIWTITVKPKYKRLQYYFKVKDKNGSVINLMENGLFDDDIFDRALIKHYFKFGWMNKADILTVPSWVKDIFWYQIFPDRFNKALINDPDYQKIVEEKNVKEWNDLDGFNRRTFYGGNIQGAMEKLEYIKDLGINGIYFNPIFVADRTHRYNIDDYLTVDPLLGTNDDFKLLVDKAHALGIKVMIDAVFNHSGLNFFAWQDVVKNKKSSQYYDWYFVNSDDVNCSDLTLDGRYYSFAYVPNMPKLNTNNPQVQEYFCNVCKKWIDMWNIDGIRFDVGNEISHHFIKRLNRELKEYHKDIFLLGEIWTDSSTYLQGDEYDSVMNYPLLQTIQNFFMDKGLKCWYLKQQTDYCYSLYRQMTNQVIFNLLDSHDVKRAMTRCGDYDSFIQEIALLATLPGSPCIYYGTEIGLEGEEDPFNRLPMPWNKLSNPKSKYTFNLVSSLVKLRTKYDLLRSANYQWIKTDPNSRFIGFSRYSDEEQENKINLAYKQIDVYINSSDCCIPIEKYIHEGWSEILFEYKYEDQNILAGGVLIVAY